MSVNHEAVAALPAAVGAEANKAAIRALLTRRLAYALAANETSADLIAVDPDTGVIPLYLIQNNIIFQYDSADSLTVHDGVTCLVTFDSKRYKSATISPPWAALDKDTIAQPASPTVDDIYLIPTAATGTDWAGKDGKVGIYTAAGWRFAVLPIGRPIYVRDETAFYHRNASGVLTGGLGSLAVAAGSIRLSQMVGLAASFVIKVVNQTTNAPPASPAVGDTYVIGSSPTGTWSGHPGKVARCEATGVFTIYTPTAGDVVYDIATTTAYTFNGTAWLSAAGAWARHQYIFTQNGSTTLSGVGSLYTYSDGTAPNSTTHGYFRADDITLSVTANRSGASLRFKWRGKIGAASGFQIVAALYRDSDAAAIAWEFAYYKTTNDHYEFEFIVTAPDAAAHTYKIRLHPADGVTTSVPSEPTRRLFQCEQGF